MNPPPLATPRLLLRPFTAADAPAIQRFASAPEIAATTATIPHPYPEGAAAGWIATHAALHASGNAALFAITTPVDGVIGSIELRIAPAHRHAELGYWVALPFWNRGIATEAARAVVCHGFETLGLKRIYAHHMSTNPASGVVLKRCGMRWEGHLRAHILRDGTFHDVELWGLVDDEFERGAALR